MQLLPWDGAGLNLVRSNRYSMGILCEYPCWAPVYQLFDCLTKHFSQCTLLNCKQNRTVFRTQFLLVLFTACPKNTYQSTETSCAQCPPNTHTEGPANERKEGCFCDAGYTGQPGGPCVGKVILNLLV